MVSIAMAVYNGEKFITEQLESILPQLKENDEIIVSDDAPGGETERLVRLLAESDSRIKYVEGRGQGLIKNFEHALSLCKGDVVFLCDQDDVWLPNKLQRVTEAINSGADLVLHDAIETDQELNIIHRSYFEKRNSGAGFLRNYIKNSYMGCCMAFKRDILQKALPFPEGIPMHDQWLGLIAEKSGKVTLLHEPLILHRIHGGNMTGGETSLGQKLKWRFKLGTSLIKAQKPNN